VKGPQDEASRDKARLVMTLCGSGLQPKQPSRY
jgi:hypothetical protein